MWNSEKPKKSNNLEYALEYANTGWLVFPVHYPVGGKCSCGSSDCQNIGKHPMTRNGFKDATTDPEQIKRWWTQYPEANIGIRSGKESGICVLDIDDRNGGRKSYDELKKKVPDLDESLFVESGSGESRHCYFSFPEGHDHIQCCNGLNGYSGLDLKADGGYIVAPPSIHKSGGTYRHFENEFKLVPLPQEIIELLPFKRDQLSALSSSEGIPEGRRNTTLVKLAGSMRAKGMEPEAIYVALKVTNEKNCTPPLPDKEVSKIVESIGKYPAGPIKLGINWKDPLPLPGGLKPVLPLDLKYFPPSLVPWIKDVAERMQCPVDYTAIASIVLVSAVVGRKIGVFPKELDTWFLVPNLWGILIGSPGQKKTGAISQILAPLRALEKEAHESHTQALSESQNEIEQINLQKEIAQKELKKAFEKQDSDQIEELNQKIRIFQSSMEELKKGEENLKRYIVNDTTVEQLGAILSVNTNGVLLLRDELSGWLASLDKSGHQTDRAFYLEAWNGNNAFVYDRVQRGTIRIPRACISVFGGIQPDKFKEYLRKIVTLEGNDGFIHRLQLLTFPDEPGFEYVDRRPDEVAYDRVEKIMRRLDQSPPEFFGAEPYPVMESHFLRFDPEAQRLFESWFINNEQLIRDPKEDGFMAQHLSKYRELMPKLALLFHLVEVADQGKQKGPISLCAAEMAEYLVRYFESHARRVYGMIDSIKISSAKALLEKILEGNIGKVFKLTEIYRRGWTNLNSKESALEACEVLEAHYYIHSREVRNPAGGRPTTEYLVNQKILKNVEGQKNSSSGFGGFNG